MQKTQTKRNNTLTAKERLIAILASFTTIVIVSGILLYTVVIGTSLFLLSDSNVQSETLRSVPHGVVSANIIYDENDKDRNKIYESKNIYERFIGNANNFVRFLLVFIYIFIIVIASKVMRRQYIWMQKQILKVSN